MNGQGNSKIIAKSDGETLSQHTIHCLKAVRALIENLPFQIEDINKLNIDATLSVSMHDIGKAAVGFQKVLKKERRDWQRKRHEIISASFALGMEGISPSAIFAILTHHKCIPSNGISQIDGCFQDKQIPPSNTPVWEEMVNEWKQNYDLFLEEWSTISKYAGINYNTNTLKPILPQFSVWLERGRRGQKTIPFNERYYTSLLRGLTIASDHLGSAHLIPSPIPKFKDYSVIKHDIRPFQEKAGSINGSAILRAPTGSGKTEAALLWAQNNQGKNGRLFYVLPYTASINAMHHRLTNIFGAGNVGMLHHRATASLYEILDDENISSLEKQNKAKAIAGLAHEIWYPIRVCTPHQILRYTLRGKGWEYMLAEFPNACLIFDEIHAYDPRIVGLTLRSAKMISGWGAKCFFVSATLPTFLQKLITDNVCNMPFIEPNIEKEADKIVLDKKRHNIEIKEGSILDNFILICRMIEKSPSTLIVCNHVKTSQIVYSKLKGLFKDNVKLLHSQFNQEDRNKKENEIISNNLPKVLVATQVVEVSLNIDFDQAFLEPAPIDALIQRMGRVNRYGSRQPANIIILTKQISEFNIYCNCNNGSHNSDCRVKSTISELQKLNNPISERDLVIAADKVYGSGYQGEDKVKFGEGYNHPDLVEFEERLLAGAHQDWVEQFIESSDGSISIEVIPKCLLDEYERRKDMGLWIEANNLLVPIKTRSLAWLKSKISTSKKDPCVVNLPYSSDIGLERNG
ncbi:MAG: CRISPR-associated helicase Cas3' [Caulobacteraceae bacterium]